MSYELPPAEIVLSLAPSRQVEVLDHLFEPCATLSKFVITQVFSTRTSGFSLYKDLIETVRLLLLKFLKTEESQAIVSPDIAKIIAAHPRLGPSKDAGALSSHSSSEQKSLAGTAEEAAKLVELNDRYETVFPGLRYVVFVNGRSRQVIMKNMIERIERGDILLERHEAFNAMCDIALDRAKKLGAKL